MAGLVADASTMSAPVASGVCVAVAEGVAWVCVAGGVVDAVALVGSTASRDGKSVGRPSVAGLVADASIIPASVASGVCVAVAEDVAWVCVAGGVVNAVALVGSTTSRDGKSVGRIAVAGLVADASTVPAPVASEVCVVVAEGVAWVCVLGGVVDAVALVGSTASRDGKSVGRISVAELVADASTVPAPVASGVCVVVAEGVAWVCVAGGVCDAVALVGSTASRVGKSVGRISVARLVGDASTVSASVASGVCVTVAEDVALVCVAGGVVSAVALIGSTASRDGKSVGRPSVVRLVGDASTIPASVASEVCVTVSEGVAWVCVAGGVGDALALVGSTASRDGKSVGRISEVRLVAVTVSVRWTVACEVCVVVAEGIAWVCVLGGVVDAVALVGSTASRVGKSVGRIAVAGLVADASTVPAPVASEVCVVVAEGVAWVCVLGGVVDAVALVGSTASRVGKSVGRISVERLVGVKVSARWTVASGVSVAVAEGVAWVCVAGAVAATWSVGLAGSGGFCVDVDSSSAKSPANNSASAAIRATTSSLPTLRRIG